MDQSQAPGAKIKKFFQQLIDYYGEWSNPNVPKVIHAYLKRDINPDRLDDLFRYICYSHPVRFGPPSVAEIEKAIKDQVDPPRGRRDVKKVKSSDYADKTELPKELTAEERTDIDKQLDDFGGLMGLIKSLGKRDKQIKIKN